LSRGSNAWKSCPNVCANNYCDRPAIPEFSSASPTLLYSPVVHLPLLGTWGPPMLACREQRKNLQFLRKSNAPWSSHSARGFSRGLRARDGASRQAEQQGHAAYYFVGEGARVVRAGHAGLRKPVPGAGEHRLAGGRGGRS